MEMLRPGSPSVFQVVIVLAGQRHGDIQSTVRFDSDSVAEYLSRWTSTVAVENYHDADTSSCSGQNYRRDVNGLPQAEVIVRVTAASNYQQGQLSHEQRNLLSQEAPLTTQQSVDLLAALKRIWRWAICAAAGDDGRSPPPVNAC